MEAWTIGLLLPRVDVGAFYGLASDYGDLETLERDYGSNDDAVGIQRGTLADALHIFTLSEYVAFLFDNPGIWGHVASGGSGIDHVVDFQVVYLRDGNSLLNVGVSGEYDAIDDDLPPTNYKIADELFRRLCERTSPHFGFLSEYDGALTDLSTAELAGWTHRARLSGSGYFVSASVPAVLRELVDQSPVDENP